MSERRECDRCGVEIRDGGRVFARRRVALVDRRWDRDIDLCPSCSDAFDEFLAGRSVPDPIRFY